LLGTITQLFRYPVKSMGGEALSAVKLEAQGIPGDRAWAVRDEERGGIRGGKRFPELMACSARYVTDPPMTGSAPAIVELPDDTELAINDDSMAECLSALVGSAVSVWPLMPAEMLDHYLRGAPLLEDFEAEMRRIFARTEDEPLPDLGAFPEELMNYESPPGTYFDAFPLLLMTTQSLQHLSSLATDQVFDVRRFRPNLLIDVDSSQPFPEREWVGRQLRIGAAEVEITMDCPRCVMTTHPFKDLKKDPGIMRTLVREASGNLGVYARVTNAATVSIGDPITFL
jgi:uncharacterized protein YcbX